MIAKAAADRSAAHSGLRQAVQHYLTIRGAHVYGNLGGLGQVKGRADLTACVGGRYVDIEIKTGKGQQSQGQRDQQERVQAAGGLYIVCRSVEDLEYRLVAEGLMTPTSLTTEGR